MASAKRKGASLPPKKRLKSAHGTLHALSDVSTLEQAAIQGLEAGTSLNALADLVSVLTTASDPKITHATIYAVYRLFVLAISKGQLLSGAVGSDEEEVRAVRQWMNAQLREYVDILTSLLKDEESGLRIAALEIVFSLLRHMSKALSSSNGQPQCHVPHFRKIIHGLLQCPPSARPTSNPSPGTGAGMMEADVKLKFVDDYLSVYDDIRWYFFRESTVILESPNLISPAASENLLSLLERLTTMPTVKSEINTFWIQELSKAPPPKRLRTTNDQEDQERPLESADDKRPVVDDWRTFFDEEPAKTATDSSKPARVHSLTTLQSLHSLESHRSQFSACWLALLPFIANSSVLSARALAVLHRGVMPHLTKPVRLMDWIAGCVDLGGSIGLLALNALFTLIKDYNLDYPDFYARLYKFLDRDVLHLKHRARFFRLAELFLSSTHLPATLLASFIKRLSRLSLSASPAAIVMIIPFVYNILKTHPACMVMIHNPEVIDEFTDPYDPEEPSPLLTNALSSSLWELASQRNHYVPSVSTLSRIFYEAVTKPSYGMEDFLDHTYLTLFEAETKRRVKGDPAMQLEQPSGEALFPMDCGKDEPSSTLVAMDPVSDLWVFG